MDDTCSSCGAAHACSTLRIRLIPIYELGASEEHCEAVPAKTANANKPNVIGSTFSLPLTLGRCNILETWWRECPNQCQAHRPESTPCKNYCWRVRRRRNRESLSREMINIDFKRNVTIVAKNKHLIQWSLKRATDGSILTSSNVPSKLVPGTSHYLAIGPAGEGGNGCPRNVFTASSSSSSTPQAATKPWMVFRLEIVRPVTPDKTTTSIRQELKTNPKGGNKYKSHEKDGDGWLSKKTVKERPFLRGRRQRIAFDSMVTTPSDEEEFDNDDGDVLWMKRLKETREQGESRPTKRKICTRKETTVNKQQKKKRGNTGLSLETAKDGNSDDNAYFIADGRCERKEGNSEKLKRRLIEKSTRIRRNMVFSGSPTSCENTLKGSRSSSTTEAGEERNQDTIERKAQSIGNQRERQGINNSIATQAHDTTPCNLFQFTKSHEAAENASHSPPTNGVVLSPTFPSSSDMRKMKTWVDQRTQTPNVARTTARRGVDNGDELVSSSAGSNTLSPLPVLTPANCSSSSEEKMYEKWMKQTTQAIDTLASQREDLLCDRVNPDAGDCTKSGNEYRPQGSPFPHVGDGNRRGFQDARDCVVGTASHNSLKDRLQSESQSLGCKSSNKQQKEPQDATPNDRSSEHTNICSTGGAASDGSMLSLPGLDGVSQSASFATNYIVQEKSLSAISQVRFMRRGDAHPEVCHTWTLDEWRSFQQEAQPDTFRRALANLILKRNCELNDKVSERAVSLWLPSFLKKSE